MKQVVMGKLHQSDSFGEISVILDEPITCSIVTASEVELGCIEPEKLRGMNYMKLTNTNKKDNGASVW